MKKSTIFPLLLFFLLLPITCYAGKYPAYLNGNANYPLVYGYMDIGTYLDKSSAIRISNNTEKISFAENCISYDIDTHDILGTYTVYFYQLRNRSDFNGAYASHDKHAYTKFFLDDTHAYNMATRNSFLMGWKILFYNDWPTNPLPIKNPK